MKRAWSRRRFIGASAGYAGAVALAPRVWAQAQGANERVRVAIVGLGAKTKNGGKGTAHIEAFRKLEGVEVAALCDVDMSFLDREVAKFTERGETVKTYTDYRKLLEDKSIDAVVIATPNHWHSLMTVWGVQAGKDVYCEKPVSHNIWEGRRAAEIIAKTDRIVQSGTQSRSDPGVRESLEWIKAGNLGKVLYIRGLCYKNRPSIGKVEGPQPPPETVDYNLWSGPREKEPILRENLHYDWHWFWSTGNGDIGNQGIHEMDLCRWFLGQGKVAPSVIGLGGRFGYIDDGQTPNTQIAVFGYESAPLIFEVRGLPLYRDSKTGPRYRAAASGVGFVVHCEGGYLIRGTAYDKEGKKIQTFQGDMGGGHQANFIAAVRSRKQSEVNCPFVEGHLSSALCHMANVSYRLGQPARPEAIVDALGKYPAAVETLGRMTEHLQVNGIDISAHLANLGPWLTMDPDKEVFTGPLADQANAIIKDTYREGFRFPDKG